MPAPVTPVRQRTQYTCGAASLSMALKSLGCTFCDEDKVNEVLGAAPMQGAAWEQIAAAANHYGCRSTLVVPSTLGQIKSWTDAGKPVLIGWNPEGRPWSHASLVFDVTETHVMVADPNCPDPMQTVRKMSHDDFYHRWAEDWNGYKVRRPAMLIDREVDSDGRQVLASRRKASILTQPLSLRHDYGNIHDLSENTSRLPEDVAITAGEDTMHGKEHHGDSDGSYMSVGYLKALADKSDELLEYIDHDTPLPDWVEAKIGQAANAINGVRDYFVYRGDEEGDMSIKDHYTLLPKSLTAGIEPMARFEEGKPADPTENMSPEDAAEWKKQNEANKDKFKAAADKVAVNLPADVERYVEQIKQKNPDYDEAQAWATAWSIYCKYKEPSSPHCQMPTSEYFKAAGDLTASWGTVLAGDKKVTMADWYEGHVMHPAISGPNTPPTEEWGSDTPDGDGNKTKRARVLSKSDSFTHMNDLEKKHGKHSKAYYEAVIKDVKAGVIAPAAVVGGGYKDGKKVALKWLEEQMKGKTASEDKDEGKEAKFEKGVSADPTENMTEAQAAEWEKQNEANKDKFKTARTRMTVEAALDDAYWKGYDKVASHGATTKAFLRKIDPKTKAEILANIAKHYGISPKEAEEEVTDADAENLLDYLTEPVRKGTSLLMKRMRLSSDVKQAAPSTVQGWLEWEG